MRELILGDIPHNYDPKKHQVLGAWCFFKKQDLLFKYQDEIPNLSLSKEEYLSIEQSTGLILEVILKDICPYLNIQSNSVHSIKYWKVMLEDWLISFISGLLEKSLKLKNFQNISEEKYHVKFYNFKNDDPFLFINEYSIAQQTNNTYNSYLFSEIIKERKIENIFPTQESSLVIFKKGDQLQKSALSLKQKILFYQRNYFRIQSIFGFNPIQIFILNIVLFFKRPKIQQTQNIIKKSAIELFSKEKWISLVKQNLPRDFLATTDFAPVGKVYKNGMYICSNFKSPTSEAVKIAKMKENGVEIFSSQHGSSYGDFYSATRNNLIELSHDGFITWGWNQYGPYPERLHPLPSPMLTKLKKSYKREKNKTYITLVSTVFTPFNLASVSGYDCQFFGDYIEKIRQIIKNLDKETYRSFYFRPRMTHRNVCFNVHEKILEEFQDLKILEGNLDLQLKHARLVIIDNPGSLMNKTLAANIPTLICWHPRCWQMSDSFNQHLTVFKKLNIYFDDPLKLSTHLNNINNDIQKWWQSNEIQTAVLSFNREFARTSKRPLFDWFKYLIKL